MLGSEFLVGVRVGVRVGGQGQGSGSGWDQFLRSVSGPGSVLRGQCQGWVTFTGQCQGLGQFLGVRVKGWVIFKGHFIFIFFLVRALLREYCYKIRRYAI